MPTHTMTVTLHVEHACDSTLALEEAVASTLCDQSSIFQMDDASSIEFRIATVVFADGGGVIQAGASSLA